MRKTYLLGNWKMQGSSAQITALLTELKQALLNDAPSESCQLALFPPALYLTLVKEALKGTPIALGAQTLSEFQPGAYTGEVAADMLIDVGCQYVLIGHSERRTLFAENDAKISGKFWHAMKMGLIPVLCVGESLSEWEAGTTFVVLQAQLAAVFEAEPRVALAPFIIAYEPVWAIGTGKVASPDYAQRVHQFIRQTLTKWLDSDSVPIVYGGSVKAANFAALLAELDIDGGLVGGAAWQVSEWIDMIKHIK